MLAVDPSSLGDEHRSKRQRHPDARNLVLLPRAPALQVKPRLHLGRLLAQKQRQERMNKRLLVPLQTFDARLCIQMLRLRLQEKER